MPHPRLLIWPTILILFSVSPAGCSDEKIAGDDDITTDNDVADDDTSPPDCADVWVTWLQQVDASPDVTVDWSTLTQSVAGDPLDPANDISQVVFAFFWLTAEEARQGLCDDSLVQSDMAFYEADNCPDDWTVPYPLDTSKYDGLSLIVSVFAEDDLGMIAVASVVEGSANLNVVLENGGAIYP